MSDIISNPAHYTEGRAYEPKDVIAEDVIAEHELNFYMGNVQEGRAYEPKDVIAEDVIAEHELNFYMGNVVKYISRAGRKEGASRVEDLEKARKYAVFELNRLKEIDREVFAGYDSIEKEAAKICADWNLSEFLEEAFKPIIVDYTYSYKISESVRKQSSVEKVIKWIGREIEKEEKRNDV